MKNLALYGDGLLCGPDGFGELLIDLQFLSDPAASIQSYRNGEPDLSLDAAAKGVAFHLIGKAPHVVLLSLGGFNLSAGDAPSNAAAALQPTLQLLLQKTQARILLTALCEAFYPAGEMRECAAAYNSEFRRMEQERIACLDLNAAVNAFLEKHRSGIGEKRALHLSPLRLTSLGRLFLANAVHSHRLWQNEIAR